MADSLDVGIMQRKDGRSPDDTFLKWRWVATRHAWTKAELPMARWKVEVVGYMTQGPYPVKVYHEDPDKYGYVPPSERPIGDPRTIFMAADRGERDMKQVLSNGGTLRYRYRWTKIDAGQYRGGVKRMEGYAYPEP